MGETSSASASARWLVEVETADGARQHLTANWLYLGSGYYDYDEKRNATPSPRALEIIEEFRAKSNLPKREITDQEIVGRTLYPMVNEGALILEEGMAQRASDIDVVWIYGYGWPVYRGGPMFWAKTEGYDKVVAGLEKHGFTVAQSLKSGSIK